MLVIWEGRGRVRLCRMIGTSGGPALAGKGVYILVPGPLTTHRGCSGSCFTGVGLSFQSLGGAVVRDSTAEHAMPRFRLDTAVP